MAGKGAVRVSKSPILSKVFLSHRSWQPGMGVAGCEVARDDLNLDLDLDLDLDLGRSARCWAATGLAFWQRVAGSV
jgi:hypothetical protein